MHLYLLGKAISITFPASMKKFGLHLLLTTFICLVLANCRHNIEEEPTPVIPCQFDSSIDEMKAWYYFKEGTWWVYEEQTTGALDTITVYYNTDFQSGESGSFEWYGNSSYDGYNYKYRFSSGFSIYCLTHQECRCHKVNRSKSKTGMFVGETNAFIFPIILNNYNNIFGYPDGQGTNGTTTVTNTNQTFELPETYINHVARFDLTTDQSIGGYASTYFIAKNIGIVQVEFPNSSEIWKLVSYQITQ